MSSHVYHLRFASAVAVVAALALLSVACNRRDASHEDESRTGDDGEDSELTSLAPGFTPNPQVLEGQAGGDREGRHWTGTAPHTDCVGHFPSQPQHSFELSDFELMSVVASAPVDLALVVEGPHGTWCNDDFSGLNPGFATAWKAGTYHFYVGTIAEGVTAKYTLTLREAKPAETEHAVIEPSFGTASFTSMAGGPRFGSEWTGTPPHDSCVGHLPVQPQHEFELPEDIEALQIVASHPTDLTMVIEGPSGTWCNDDFEGPNPGLVGTWPAGTYRVFVGTFDGEFAPGYTLTLTELRPVETTQQSLAPGFSPAPYTVESVAGGPTAGDAWTGTGEHTDCTGHFPEKPQHVLQLETFPQLTVVAEAEADLTMVIEGPAGAWCNDDFAGTNPGIRNAFPAGTYRIFVGTYRGAMVPYTLRVVE
jgi:hypothetical protein